MKLYVFERNIQYNEHLSSFITMSLDERNELFKHYKQSEKEVEVELFATGSTCLCYKVAGDSEAKVIYKQFCPLSFEKKGYIIRRNDAVYISGQNEIDFIKEQYDNFLKQTFNNVVGIGATYNIEEINMFIRPEIVLTNLGYMFCSEITGGTLKESYNELLLSIKNDLKYKDLLGDSLYKTFRTLQVVKVAQESDILILDLKGENLLNVSGDERKEELLVRLIDFGSCLNYENMITLIRQEETEIFLEQYIYSNKKYYSKDEIEMIVKSIACDENDCKERAKNLDILAAKKILCDVLKCATDGFMSLDDNNQVIETSNMENILTDFFEKFSNKMTGNLLEQYNIYSELIIFLRTENIYGCLQALANILSVLGYRAGNQSDVFWTAKIGGYREESIEDQKRAILFHENIKKQFDFIKDNKQFFGVEDCEELYFQNMKQFCKCYNCSNVGELYLNVYKQSLSKYKMEFKKNECR